MKRLLLVLLLLFPSFAWASRVALVIGNGNYRYTNPLPNAPNDAADMAATLTAMGFTVFGGIDLTRAETLAAVDDFSAALTPETLALFFYAGHGAQIGAENVVIPVDAAGGTAQDLMGASIRLTTILRTMELRADRRVVILDACRNNPFLEAEAARSGGPLPAGLARVEAGVGSYIAFSTQPGNVALDGAGRNSPFTEALLTHITADGLDIHAVMRRVRSDVVAATGQTQVPWENSSLVDELFLVSGPAPAAAPSASGETGNASLPLTFIPGQPGAPAAVPQPFAAQPDAFAAQPEPFAAQPEPFAAQPEPFAPQGNSPFAAAPQTAAPGAANPFAKALAEGLSGVPSDDAPPSSFAVIDFGAPDDDGPVSGAKVGSLDGDPPPLAMTYMVTGLAEAGYGFVTLRDRPAPSGNPMGSLTDGTPLEILQAEGEWVYVRTFDGLEGWAAAQWVGCCAE